MTSIKVKTSYSPSINALPLRNSVRMHLQNKLSEEPFAIPTPLSLMENTIIWSVQRIRKSLFESENRKKKMLSSCLLELTYSMIPDQFSKT